MGSFGKMLSQEEWNERLQRAGIRISKEPDEKGRYVIENFNGSDEELFKILNCIPFEESMEKLNDK